MQIPSSATSLPGPSKSLADIVKQAAEILTVLAVASYALGFIIVNSYLLTYGNSGSGLFKVKYISAGLLFILIASLICVSLSAIFWAKLQKEEAETNKRKAIIWAPSFILYIVTLLFTYISDNDLQVAPNRIPWPSWVSFVVLGVYFVWVTVESSSWEWRGVKWLRKNPGLSYLLVAAFYSLSHLAPMTGAILLLITLNLFQLMRLGLHEVPLSTRYKEWPLSVIYEFALGIVFFLVMVGAFGTYLYGHILPQFGGGKPARVRVVLTGEKRDQLKPLGYEEDTDALLSDTLLIDSNDTEYSLLIKKDSGTIGLLLQVRKDLVNALLFYPASRE